MDLQNTKKHYRIPENGAYKNRVEELKRMVRKLEKIQQGRDRAEADINDQAEHEISYLKEAASDLLRIKFNHSLYLFNIN